jgi:DNA-binding transcriptional ArsR family regulator
VGSRTLRCVSQLQWALLRIPSCSSKTGSVGALAGLQAAKQKRTPAQGWRARKSLLVAGAELLSKDSLLTQHRSGPCICKGFLPPAIRKWSGRVAPNLVISTPIEMKTLCCPAHDQPSQEKRFPSLERIFQALGSSARLCLVNELSGSEGKCVGDLVGCCDLSWSTVSHHLSILREAGIVVDEKQGKQVIYRLALPCVVDFIGCLESGDCHFSPTRFGH